MLKKKTEQQKSKTYIYMIKKINTIFFLKNNKKKLCLLNS